MPKPQKTAPSGLVHAPPVRPLDPYAEGVLDALRILKTTRDDMDAPIREVRDKVGSAYVALNGVTHWGHSLVSEAESRIMRHLIDRDAGVDAKEGA